MSEFNERPIIFPLSNPTSHAECTAEEAYRYSDGRAVFLSGSPFGPFTVGERTWHPGQGNNAYIFPGIGLGLIGSRARRVTETMFLAAARVLDTRVSEEALAEGRLVPSLKDIRNVSRAIALAVAEVAYAEGLTREPRPKNLPGVIDAMRYDGSYSDRSERD